MSPKLLNILLVMLPVVIYVTVIDPLNTGVGTIWSPENSISTLQSLNEQYTVALDNTDMIEKGVEAVYRDYKKIDPDVLIKNDYMLSNSVDVAKIRNEVVDIASKQGIAIDGLEVVKDRKGGKIAEFYLVTFSLKSRYLPFKKLLEEFDKNMRFYTIESLSVARQKIDQNSRDQKNIDIDKDALNIQVRFRVYQANNLK